ncbi:MAG: ribbon-helix-helix domain-containing protein [Thiotrichales bacterium]|nr:ribbon-helix-helix domain-containing protein [Thiotrichales bacterium]MCY4284535.1 ribbon-helix-helix domain-containing protein [Thiotrichales bacterium]MCY4351240.1 ribbon-helix-helix domain-containing protein [Thiotrichales bacterium]
MCQIFAGQPRGSYRQVTRSFRLHGHSTSVRLEAKFWEIVEEIATAQDMTTAQFLARIHDEVEETHGKVENFASLLRCACLLYLRSPPHAMEAARREVLAERTTAPPPSPAAG